MSEKLGRAHLRRHVITRSSSSALIACYSAHTHMWHVALTHARCLLACRQDRTGQPPIHACMHGCQIEHACMVQGINMCLHACMHLAYSTATYMHEHHQMTDWEPNASCIRLATGFFVFFLSSRRQIRQAITSLALSLQVQVGRWMGTVTDMSRWL